MKNDDLNFFHISLKIHKRKEKFGGNQTNVWMEKLQQISIPFLICLSCLRTLLRGDYEFLKHIFMQFSFPRRMRCNKSFYIVNFNSSRPVIYVFRVSNHFCIRFFLRFFSDFKAVKNVQSQANIDNIFHPLLSGVGKDE